MQIQTKFEGNAANIGNDLVKKMAQIKTIQRTMQSETFTDFQNKVGPSKGVISVYKVGSDTVAVTVNRSLVVPNNTRGIPQANLWNKLAKGQSATVQRWSKRVRKPGARLSVAGSFSKHNREYQDAVNQLMKSI